MKNAQNWLKEWLEEKYPQINLEPNERNLIEEIDNAYGEELSGELIIENFPRLEKIFLGGNKSITKLIIRNCPQVKEIDVPDNKITELIINELLNLETLNCNKNQLTTLDISQNTKLKSLFCFNNPHLTKDNFKGIEKLTQLKQFKYDEELCPVVILKENYENQIQQIGQRLNRVQINLNQQVSDLTQELNNEKEKNDRLIIENEEIAEELINNHDKINSLQTELETQKQINTIIQEEKECLEQKLVDFELEFNSLKERKGVAERLLENIQEERDEYRNIASEKLDELENLKTTHKIAIELVAKEQNKNEELKKKLISLENKFGEKLIEIKYLKEQLQNQDKLQNEIHELKNKLINYVQFIFQEILSEQERIKNSIDNNDNWFLALERQRKIINQLKEIFGNELNKEQLKIFLQLQEQLANLQTQLYKNQIKRIEEVNRTQIIQPCRKNY